MALPESLPAEYERMFATLTAPEVQAFELATQALVTYGRAYYTKSPQGVDPYCYEPLETGLLAITAPIKTEHGHAAQAVRVYINEYPSRAILHPTLLNDIRDAQSGQADPAEVVTSLRNTITKVTCETYLIANNQHDLSLVAGVPDDEAHIGEFLEGRAPDATPQPLPKSQPHSWSIAIPDQEVILEALESSPDLRLYVTPIEPTLALGYQVILKHRRPQLASLTEEKDYRDVAQRYLNKLEASYNTYTQLVRILADPVGRVASLEAFRPAPPADAGR
jgi:hypothetical protein